jgi:hypothetical protein
VFGNETGDGVLLLLQTHQIVIFDFNIGGVEPNTVLNSVANSKRPILPGVHVIKNSHCSFEH